MPTDRSLRTEEDLQRTVRALATEFKTDTVFIIGSQAIMMSWPDAPPDMRGTPEIDAYPGNARVWEIEQARKGGEESQEASEHIHGLFGEGSNFHITHGFYIDGVDEGTARLPRGWNTRAVLDDKDKDFVSAYHRARPLDLQMIEARIKDTPLHPAVAARAIAFVHGLP